MCVYTVGIFIVFQKLAVHCIQSQRYSFCPFDVTGKNLEGKKIWEIM